MIQTPDGLPSFVQRGADRRRAPIKQTLV